ncbi:hypothetical protein FACS1894180_3260 [Bacteroidia bacterium]|nr:hypothetical protein FACS1894180_3260 [Bacteroidia bacterium]
MKNILINTAKFLFIALLCTTTACQEDIVTWDDNLTDETTPNGAPKIEYVTRASDTASVKTPITEGNLSEMVAIYGENLSQVQSLFFNDVEADLATVYAVNSHIIVPIPRLLPNEVTNKIKVTTSQGTVEYDFTVNIPPLVITGLYNEFCSAGDTVDIVGNNFDLYGLTGDGAQITINGAALTIIKSNASALTVVIPAGTPDNTAIEISSAEMDSPQTVKFRNFGQILQNYGDGVWGDTEKYKTDGTHSGDPKPLEGVPVFQRVNAALDAWSWNVPYAWGYNGIDDWNASPTDWQLKFEVNTNKPFSVGDILFMGYPNNENTRYHWNPAVGGISFDTYGKWKTVTIEYTQLVAVGWAPVVGGWNDFGFVYQPHEAATVDFSIANARMVHK